MSKVINQPLLVGIVEDNPVSANLLVKALKVLGYRTLKVAEDYAGALSLIEDSQPDILLLDIQLKGRKDGIDLAEYVNRNHHIPFIYLSDTYDAPTLERAKFTMPLGYLIKPFNMEELRTTIEVAFHNYHMQKRVGFEKESPLIRVSADALYVKEGAAFQKVRFDDILYLESDHVYVIIHTMNQKYTVRSSMTSYLEHFDRSRFVRIHRTYIINISCLDRIEANMVQIGAVTLPLAKSYRDELLAKLNLG